MMLYRSRTENNIYEIYEANMFLSRLIVMGLEHYYKLEELSPTAKYLCSCNLVL